MVSVRSIAEVDRESLLDHYRRVRATTELLAAPLSDEDQCLQSMPDASPTKWHRAHTTWFFETFVLSPFDDGYQVHDERYSYLFNSYYEAIGARHARPERGLLTRPSCHQPGRLESSSSVSCTSSQRSLWPTCLSLTSCSCRH